MDRYFKYDKPCTAIWYARELKAFPKMKEEKDLRLNGITVARLTNFHIKHDKQTIKEVFKIPSSTPISTSLNHPNLSP